MLLNFYGRNAALYTWMFYDKFGTGILEMLGLELHGLMKKQQFIIEI